MYDEGCEQGDGGGEETATISFDGCREQLLIGSVLAACDESDDQNEIRERVDGLVLEAFSREAVRGPDPGNAQPARSAARGSCREAAQSGSESLHPG